MKVKAARFLSGFMVVFLLVFLCVPSFASAGSQYEQVTGFWGWLSHMPIVKEVFGYSSGAVCPKSEDQYHHATTYQREGKKEGYYKCICSYCGQTFTAYESDLKQSYQDQVSTLPVPGYNSEGRLIWSPSYADYKSFSSFRAYVGYVGNIVISSLPFTGTYKHNSYGVQTYTFSLNDSGGFCISYRGNAFFRVELPLYFSYPVTGAYKQLSSLWCSYSILLNDGTRHVESRAYGGGSSFVNCDAGSDFYWNVPISLSGSSLSFSAEFYLPVYEIIPDTFIDTTPTGPYGINSRPTTITGGNLGIVGDNGQITTINNNQQIINETNNTYYNPATGQTGTITDWSYNYDGRIYTITLDTGDTVNVEYGDENITITENTINEGDTIVNNYTIYYIIDGGGENPGPGPSGSPDPGPTVSVCPHIWKEVNRTEPGCTSPGTAQYICSQCGETKVETLKATGHTWQVLRTVQTAYDEEGNLVQQGYTIYQCAVCSEQYKDDQGTGPPGGGGSTGEDKETIWDKIANFFGSIVDGIAGIFEAILGKLLDALTALSEMLMGKVKDVVEVVLSVLDEVPKLFDGFLNFLGVVFPFIPAEITLLLTFGVIAVVFIGIIKAIRR